MVKGVIFDMDGTMFDTERLSTKGWIYAGKKLGVDIPVALTDSFRGRNPQAIRKKFAAYFGDRLDYDTARAMKHEYFDEVTKESVPHKEGLQDLLEYLKEHEIPAVVATSTERKRASRLIHMSGIEHLISNAIYGDMVERGKPEPDIFLKAAELIGQDPKECLVLEDSAPGLLAGKAAGGYTIYVPDIAVVSKEAKEGITAEPEALNVIAMKADGGMRDALSIFDQVVSFTGGNITYKSVIDNLNVLDYEYYFRLTDCFLENKVSDALLLFNDILNKGFDGSHFITGLSSHFRDLLVGKDPVTLPLLEVGASIRQRYQEQAQKCPLPFLYRAMKLCNECDLNYRISKNKRLLVELTLIQVAQLTTEGDDVSGGRGPKKTIKPVFTQPAAAQQPQVASGTQVQQAPVHSSPSSVTTQAANGTTAQHPQASAAVQPGAPASPGAASSAPSQGAGVAQTAKEERKIPVMKMSSLGVSIKNPQRDQVSQNAATTYVPKVQQPEEDFMFNDRDLNYYWQEYAGQLPKEQDALAKRMQMLRPALLNNSTTFEVVVDNEFAAKDFTALIPELQDYLRGRLKNSKVMMTVRVSEATETVRPVGRVEKFQMMAQKNQALMQLKDEFGLELY